MSELTFDAFSRHAARAVTRRASMLALGGTALTAVFAAALPAGGKSRKRKKGKKGKKDINQLCARQVAQCRTAIVTICSGDTCPVIIEVCCPLLGTCQNSAFFDCLAGSS